MSSPVRIPPCVIFCILPLFLFLFLSLVFSLLLFVSVSWTNASSCVKIRARRILSFALVSRTYSALARFSISFYSLFHSSWRHFCPRTPRPVTSFLLFFRSPSPSAAESSFSFIFVVHPLHFSFSFDAYAALCPRRSRATASFIVFIPRCPPYFSDVAPRPSDTSPRFSTHVYMYINARSLIFLGFPFSRVRPAIARANVHAIPLRDVSRFPFRYVRSVHDTWSVLPCLDIVLFCCAKCIPQGISPIFVPSSRRSRARSPLPIPQIPSHFVTSPMGYPWKYDTLDSLPLPTLIRHAARESGEPQDRRTRQTLLVRARIPSQTIFSWISVNSPFRPENGGIVAVGIRGVTR